MASKPRSRKETQKASSLLEALTFVNSILKDEGTPYETHVQLQNNWALAFNGVLAAGHKIEESLNAYPHANTIVTALNKCTDALSITHLPSNKLSIKSDKFRALVPCLNTDIFQQIIPDQPIANVDDRFKKALEIVGVLASENSDNVLTASILMNGYSLIATDRKFILEAWHGIDLPPNITLPKAFVAPIVKTKKPLARFGFSHNSVTFYFDDGSWIKSQTFAEQWPNVNHLLSTKANLWNVPENFFEGVKAIERFSDDGNIYFRSNLIQSSEHDQEGASYEVYGVPPDVIYPAKYLNMLNGIASKIDFVAEGAHTSSYCLVFQGDAARGIIAGRAR